MMRLLTPVVFLLALTVPAAAQRVPDPGVIDAEAARLTERESVQGLALAVIDRGEIVYVAAYGYRNVRDRLPLTTETVMYGASLTKPAVAYLALQLVDEGRLDLDVSLTELLPRPLPAYDEGDDDYSDLADDPRWRDLTPRTLLTHSPGFANFRWLEPDGRLRFHFDPGSRYSYSGDGFHILQLALERGLGLELGRAMQQRVFERFGMTNTGMEWRPDFADNLADGYALDGTMEPHDERSSPSAAGSMDTSISDQARLWAGIVRGDGLTPAARAELVRSQLPITAPHQFPTLATDTAPENAAIGLSAGLGLVTFDGPQGRTWFKGGHDPWTGNMLICIEARQRCLVMLANDVRAERIYPELARFILGDAGVPWRWEYNDG